MAVGPQPVMGAGTQASDLSEAVRNIINGRLEVTPAYYQTDDDEAVQITVNNNTRLAVAIVPPVDMALSSISRYVTAVATPLDAISAKLYLYDNGSAKEPNGDLNGSDTPGSPTNMTANDAPSPYVVEAVTYTGVTVAGDTGIYAALNTDPADSTYVRAGLNVDAGPAVDKGDGKVGIPVTGHGVAAGTKVLIAGTINYNNAYTVEAETTTNEIVITETYVAETFDGSEYCYVPVSDNNPLGFCLDLGAGGEKIFNAIELGPRSASNTYCLKEVAILGSNEASPTKDTDDDWTELKSATSLDQITEGTRVRLSWTNGTAYRHYKIKITDSYDQDLLPRVWLGKIYFYEAQDEDAPGTLLETLPMNPTVGDTADVWQTDTIDEGYEPQLQAGKKYWIVERL